MMPAHCLLDLAEYRDPLRARMPLPKQDKSLSTHTAVELCVPIRAFAKYLHNQSLPVPMVSTIPPVNIVNSLYG